MNVAFLSEVNNGLSDPSKTPRNFENARVEYAWYITTNGVHYYIGNYTQVKNYDAVCIILPKIKTNLNSEGSVIGDTPYDHRKQFFNPSIIEYLKNTNKKVYIIQEGPNWMFTDYEIEDQINYYNCLAEVDGILTHNERDVRFFKGLFYGNKEVYNIPSLLIEDNLIPIQATPEDKTIVGGNWARWYGGFQGYTVAKVFENEIWTHTSHAMRKNEDKVEDINHIPRISWTQWMETLSTFKYAVHLMPTIAAGTFNLNCAYFGIPCIGNIDSDTQRKCYPDLSIHVDDILSAVELAQKLKNDKEFYNECSIKAKNNYKKYFSENVWKQNMKNILT